MVGVCVHQGSDCSHAAAPNTYTADSAQASQVLENCINVTTFIVAQGNVLAFGEPAAREVESEDSNVPADQVGDYPGPTFK